MHHQTKSALALERAGGAACQYPDRGPALCASNRDFAGPRSAWRARPCHGLTAAAPAASAPVLEESTIKSRWLATRRPKCRLSGSAAWARTIATPTATIESPSPPFTARREGRGALPARQPRSTAPTRCMHRRAAERTLAADARSGAGSANDPSRCPLACGMGRHIP
jgi:hypothetical protein